MSQSPPGAQALAFRPLGDRALIRLKERDEKTPGGIIIPDTVDPERGVREGTIIAVGPGALLEDGQRRSMAVIPDQVVLFGQYSGTAVLLDGDEYFVVREDDIQGSVEGS